MKKIFIAGHRGMVGFQGELVFDIFRLDGTPRKLMDVSRLERLGWKANIKLEAGLEQTYRWFVEQGNGIREV